MDVKAQKAGVFPQTTNPEAGSSVTVKVVLMGELRQLAGRRELEVELPQGSTLRTLAKRLAALCGDAFVTRVMTPQGEIHSHVAVFVNGVDTRQLKDNQTLLTGGEVELMLLPMYEGGAQRRR